MILDKSGFGITKIHSVAGKLTKGSMLKTKRPFRTPHHTVSPVALVGGGTNPMPGKISPARSITDLETSEYPSKINVIITTINKNYHSYHCIAK